MSSGVPYIGSKISLITTSDMRYEGPCAQRISLLVSPGSLAARSFTRQFCCASQDFSINDRSCDYSWMPTLLSWPSQKSRFLRTLNREESTIAVQCSVPAASAQSGGTEGY